jgi:hypothetical protein
MPHCGDHSKRLDRVRHDPAVRNSWMRVQGSVAASLSLGERTAALTHLMREEEKGVRGQKLFRSAGR